MNKFNSDYKDQFQNKYIFFVTPDVKRALGLENLLQNYHIICTNKDPLIGILKKQGAKIFCLADETDINNIGLFNNTSRLLGHEKVINYIRTNSKSVPDIMFFKPSLKTDILIRKFGFNQIGNDSELNEEFENKINSYSFFKSNFPLYTIPGETGIFKKFIYKTVMKRYGIPFLIQFGHGWAGKTTFIIANEEEYIKLASKFSETIIKISKFIFGYTILNNCTIYKDKIFISPPAIQLSNVYNLLASPFVTCGRQWPAKYLSEKQVTKIHDISQQIGKLMNAKSYRGFFGVDFIIEDKSGNIFISEINARLTASSAFYTKLELREKNIPQMVYHIASFLNLNIPEINTNLYITGSQIIIRSQKNMTKIRTLKDSGVYTFSDNKFELLRKEYKPEELGKNEYIISQRYPELLKQNDNELGRIEVNDMVLSNKTRLSNKYERMIT